MSTLRLEPARVGTLTAREGEGRWYGFDLQLAIFALSLTVVGLLMAFTNSADDPLRPGSIFTRGLIWLALAAIIFLVRDVLPRREVAVRGETPVARIKRVVPESDRVRVEVLNGTSTRGLARRATAAMRDAGFDVVSSGNATERPDSSLVIVRTGREDWAALAAKALGGARIQLRPDTSRYVDRTIVIGSLWRPPVQPLDP